MKRVILVRPRGPRNVGMALRASANFGPAELWVVAPDRPSVLRHPDFEQMAHGVPDLGERVVVADDLRHALAETTWAVGFTARTRGHRLIRDWSEVQGEIGPLSSEPEERVALVFGNEESGLSTPEADLLQELTHISTAKEHGSINLAMTVTIVLQSLYDGPRNMLDSKRGVPLTGAEREYLKRHIADTLGAKARSAAVKREIETSAERVFSRAPLETRDAGAWHAVLRALGNSRSPLDYGIGDAASAEPDDDGGV